MGGTPKRENHPYWMYDMINSQSTAIARILKEEKGTIDQFAQAIVKLFKGNSEKKTIHLVGIGTSWHACVISEHFGRMVSGVDCRAWHSFDFSCYVPKLNPENDIVIIFAHRGTKHFSTSALEEAKKVKVMTGLITGIESNPTVLADFVLRTSEGDKSSAYTVSLTSALTVSSMILSKVGILFGNQDAKNIEEQLVNLPDWIKKTISLSEETSKKAAKSYKGLLNFFIGYGINTAVAYETALKIKETSYSPCEGLQLEQFLHGPFCGVYQNSSTTFLIPSNIKNEIPRNRAIMMLKSSQKVAKSVMAICQEDDNEIISLLRENDFVLKIPKGIPENLSAIPCLVNIQLFTYYLSLEYGTNPDIFREDDPLHQNASKIWNLYGLEEKTK